MSAKDKLRAEALHWKSVAEESDSARIQYAGIVAAILSKFGGEMVIPKDALDSVTKRHAIQSTTLPDGAVMLRLLVTKPEAPSRGN